MPDASATQSGASFRDGNRIRLPPSPSSPARPRCAPGSAGAPTPAKNSPPSGSATSARPAAAPPKPSSWYASSARHRQRHCGPAAQRGRAPHWHQPDLRRRLGRPGPPCLPDPARRAARFWHQTHNHRHHPHQSPAATTAAGALPHLDIGNTSAAFIGIFSDAQHARCHKTRTTAAQLGNSASHHDASPREEGKQAPKWPRVRQFGVSRPPARRQPGLVGSTKDSDAPTEPCEGKAGRGTPR
jgi:hypothetical protein